MPRAPLRRLAFWPEALGLGTLARMSERLRYTELAPEGTAQMRGLEHYLNAGSTLPAVLLELVRLRVSLLNGCDFCVGHHTRELKKHNEPVSRIEALQDWAGSEAFTPRERAALRWADSVTEIRSSHAADAEYNEVRAYFEGKDLVDLTMAIASINAWNRMSIAFRATWNPGRGKKEIDSIPRADEEGMHKGLQEAEPVSIHPPQENRPAAAGAQSVGQITSTPPETPERDAVDDDGGKVAQD